MVNARVDRSGIPDACVDASGHCFHDPSNFFSTNAP